MANKHEKLSIYDTSFMMNLVGNDSVANLYVIPSTENSEHSAAVDRWNYPVKHFELYNHGFLKLTLNKEHHMRKSTEGSPCTALDEETYYRVLF